jgi:hypothetical protein
MKKSDMISINIKMTREELDALKLKARRPAHGNLSAWLRHAGLRYKMKEGEIIVCVPMPIVCPVLKKKKR